MPRPSELLKAAFKEQKIEEKEEEQPVVVLNKRKRDELARLLDLLFASQPAFDPAATFDTIAPDPIEPVEGLPYLMVTNRSEMSQERALAVNTTLTKVDGGANGALTLSINLANANTWTALQSFSAGVRTNDGTAAAPAYSFTSATDYGVNRAGFTLEFSVSGVARAYINTNGFAAAAFGSATTPPFSFLSATTSGMYLVAVGQLGFTVSGGQAAVLTSAGQLQLPVSGSGAGLLAVDALWYRDAADTWRTPDKVRIDSTANPGLRLGTVAPPASKVGALEVVQTGAADGIVLAENAATRLTVMVAGVSVSAGVVGYHSRGTLASPSASQVGDVLVTVEGRGHGATGYASGSRGGLSVEVDSSAWTDTSHPTALFLSATPALSTTVRRALKVTTTSNTVEVSFWDVTNNRTKILATFSEALNKIIWGGEGDGFTSPGKHEWDVAAFLKMSLDADGLTVLDGINVGTATLAADGEVRASVGFAARVNGSGGGMFAGAASDVLLYRSGADTWRTPDSLTVDAGLNLGTGTGAAPGHIVGERSANTPVQWKLTNLTNGTAAETDVQVINSAGTLTQIGIYSPTTTAYGALTSGAGFLYTSSSRLTLMVDHASGIIVFAPGGNTEDGRMDANGNFVWNTAVLATTATDGFVYIPTMAGTPTGTPTAYTGRVPIVFDTTNLKLYIYSGGWKSVTFA